MVKLFAGCRATGRGLRCLLFALVLVAGLAAADELTNPLRPLALSANGDWRVHGDGSSLLVRTSLKDASVRQVVDLGKGPRTISVTRSARRALVSTTCESLALIDFDAPNPSVDWLREGGCPIIIDKKGVKSHPFRAAGISPDGALMAYQAYRNRIGIFRVADRSRIASFPLSTSKKLLHVEFLPGNRFLLIVDKGEKRPDRHDSRWVTGYSLWNLESLALHSRFEVESDAEPADGTTPALSHFSGEAWSMKSTGDGSGHDFLRFPLQRCAINPDTPTKLRVASARGDAPPAHWVADAYGRWLAVGKMLEPQTPRSAKQFVVDILDVSAGSSGRRLARHRFEGEVRQMRAALDGTKVWLSFADGRIEAYDLPREALRLQLSRFDPASGYCLPEDEEPAARQVEGASPTHGASLIASIGLATAKGDERACPQMYAPWLIGAANSEIVHQADGMLVFNDPANGNELRRLPLTADARNRCVLRLNVLQGFLIQHGDTIEFQHWFGDRVLVARKRGWKPVWIAAGWHGNYRRIGFVTWVRDSDRKGAGKGQALSSAYVIDRGELIREVPASVLRCSGDDEELPVVSCDERWIQLTADEKERFVEREQFSAEIGPYGDLIVRQHGAANDAARVIFRRGAEGIRSDASETATTANGANEGKKSKKATSADDPMYFAAHVLSDRLLLGIGNSRLEIFDFRERRLVARIDRTLEQIAHPAWHDTSATLWFLPRGGQAEFQGWRLLPNSK